MDKTSNPSRTQGKRSAASAGEGKGRSRAGTVRPVRTYLVTLSAREDGPPFAEPEEGGETLTGPGRLVADCWRDLGRHRPGLEPGDLSVGPRLVRGILGIRADGAEPLTLSGAVRLFKALSTRRLAGGAAPAAAVWKKGFVERPLDSPKQVTEARGALKSSR